MPKHYPSTLCCLAIHAPSRTLQEELDIVSEELAESRSRAKEVEEQLDEMAKKHDVQRVTWTESASSIDKLNAELEATQEKLYSKEKEAQEHVTASQAAADGAKAEAGQKLAEAQERAVEILNQRMQEWEQEKETLTKDLDCMKQQDRELKELQQQLLEARSEVAEAKAEAAAAKSEAAAAATAAAAAGLLGTGKDQGNSEVGKTSDETTGSNGKEDDSESEGGGREGEVAGVTVPTGELCVETLEGEVQQSKVQISRLVEEKEILYRQVAQEQQARTAWGAEKEHLKQRQSDLEKQIANREADLKEVAEKMEKQKSALTSLASTSTKEQEQAVEETEAKVKDFGEKLSQANNEKAEMQKKYEALSSELNEQKDSLADAMAVRGRLRQVRPVNKSVCCGASFVV